MVHLSLLGSTAIEAADGLVTGPAARRHPLALLALLARSPHRQLAREKLVGYLWPERPIARGRQRLRETLRVLRHALGPDALESVGDEIRLNAEMVGADLWQFEQAVAVGEYRRAVALYSGPFLDGFNLSGAIVAFERWLEQEREAIARDYRRSLETVAEEAGKDGRSGEAAAWWHRLATEVPTDDRVAVRLMEALATAEDRVGALEYARHHARFLEEEYGTTPGPGVVKLAARLGDERPDSGSVIDPRRVLVAPLRDATDDPSLAAVGALAGDWIAGGLAETGRVRVVPPAALLSAPEPTSGAAPGPAAAGPSERLYQAAQRTGCGLLVHGSCHVDGDALILRAQVVDVTSHSIGAPIRDVVGRREDPAVAVEALRRRATAAVVMLLDPRARPWAAAASQPPDLETYQLLADGIDALRHWDRKQAMDRLLQAAARDAGFTAPLIWAMSGDFEEPREADALVRQLLPRRETLPPWDRAMLDYHAARVDGNLARQAEAIQAVVEMVPGSHWVYEAAGLALSRRRATEALAFLDGLRSPPQDPLDPDRYWFLRTAVFHALTRYEEERSDARRWQEHAESENQAEFAEMRALLGLERHTEARSRIEALVGSADWRPGLAYLARKIAHELRAHGRSEEVGEVLEQAVTAYETAPDSARADGGSRLWYGRVLADLGHEEEARHVFQTLLEEGFKEQVVRGDLALLAAARGDRDEAERAMTWYREHNERFSHGWHTQWRARIAAALGQRDRALRLIRKATSEGWGWGWTLHPDRAFQALAADPVFEALMGYRKTQT